MTRALAVAVNIAVEARSDTESSPPVFAKDLYTPRADIQYTPDSFKDIFDNSAPGMPLFPFRNTCASEFALVRAAVLVSSRPNAEIKPGLQSPRRGSGNPKLTRSVILISRACPDSGDPLPMAALPERPTIVFEMSLWLC